jgi:hypothetical protein
VAFNMTIQVTGVEETIQFIEEIPPMTRMQTLNAFRLWGSEMVELGQELSPKDKLRGKDPRRRPEAESFAMKWDYEVNPVGEYDAELLVGNVAEHMQFVIYGTQPHPIPRSVTAQLAKGYPMSFFWVNSPGGAAWHQAWKISGGVAAQGTEPHPVHEQIVERFDFNDHLALLARGVIGSIE